MWLYHSLAGSEITSLLFKENGQKEVENGFLGLSCDLLLAFLLDIQNI